MRYVLSNIRLNHAQANIIMTVGIAFSPALVRKKKPTPARCCFYIDQCKSSAAEQSCNDIPHRQQPRRKSSKPVLDSCSSINQRLSAAILGTLLLGQRLQRFLLSINGPTLECPASQYCISIIIGRLQGPRLCWYPKVLTVHNLFQSTFRLINREMF